MKLQRTGYCETNLLFCDYLKNTLMINDDYLNTTESHFINWLYSSSGWYDKTISGSYFDINYNQVLKSHNYIKFIEKYRYAISNSDYITILLHTNFYFNNYTNYQTQFYESFNSNYDVKSIYSNYWNNPEKIYHLLNNKSVLVISSFDSLIYSQYYSGNIHKITSYFPLFKKLQTLNFPYCFFNNGPHQNGFETLAYILNKVKGLSFDIALVGAGPYGAMIVDLVCAMGKDAITMCSGISKMFGIDPGGEPRPYWITTIPDKYIPKNARKIENGRYWYGKNMHNS